MLFHEVAYLLSLICLEYGLKQRRYRDSSVYCKNLALNVITRGIRSCRRHTELSIDKL